MVDVLQREFIYVWCYFVRQLVQIWRYYALGIVLGSVISEFARDRIHGIFRSLGDKKLGIAEYVSTLGIPTREGNLHWKHKAISYILSNERYVGDSLLQKNTLPTPCHSSKRSTAEKRSSISYPKAIRPSLTGKPLKRSRRY